MTSKKPKPYWTKSSYPGAMGSGDGEWNCPHGVGHGNHIHGCDGCCSRDDYPGRPIRPATRDKVYKLIDRERAHQIRKWGAVTPHTPEKWLTILAEEVGEVARNVLGSCLAGIEVELEQVAAVAVAWLEEIRKTRKAGDDSDCPDPKKDEFPLKHPVSVEPETPESTGGQAVS